MKLGTDQEIEVQMLNLEAAEHAVMAAKLRLRALRGEALLQVGDSFPTLVLDEELDRLSREFGSRNIRMM